MLLDVQDLTVALPKGGDRANAIANVNITLSANEIVCIVGESGSGKSVTAQAAMGLLPPELRVSGGRILLEDVNLLSLSEARMRSLRGSRIAMVFQDPATALNPLMRIGDQIAEIFRYHTALKRPEIAVKVEGLLAAVGLPDPAGIRFAYPFQLSGGQRQRVMIAASLALEPAVIIADEPTTALDVTTQAQILRLLIRLQAERGIGLLYITHDFGVVAEIAHRVVVMQQGRVVETGPAEQILNRPAHAYTRMLLSAVPRLSLSRETQPGGAMVCEARGLRKTYAQARRGLGPAKKTIAVNDVTLELRRGEIVALLGESGSGKSTVARILVNLIEPDEGKVFVDDVDFGALRGSALRIHRRKIQMVFQDPQASLNPRHKVGRIIADVLRAHGVAASEVDAKARKFLELVRLDPTAADRYPHEFSGGQRQRIGIARAIALDPDILIADEPVSALDVSVQAQILDLLEDLRRRLSIAILFITHDLRVASQICDRVIVMRRGEIVESGPTAEVFRDPQHEYTRGLLAALPGLNWRKPEASPRRDGDTESRSPGF